MGPSRMMGYCATNERAAPQHERCQALRAIVEQTRRPTVLKSDAKPAVKKP